jgi:site-specific recombinase XerD
MKHEKSSVEKAFPILSEDAPLIDWADSFLVDRKVRNLSRGTLKFYREHLKKFINYCNKQGISQISQVNANVLRKFMLHLEEVGHNPGGIHAFYRTVKAFLRWYEIEAEPKDWRNPIRKVKAPSVDVEPLDPVDVSDITDMIEVCQRGTFTGERDRAILLALLDTGARAQEFLDINLDDIDVFSGEITIRKGKGRKPRTVFLGTKSRRAVRAYLKLRTDKEKALWVRDDGEGRLVYNSLRYIIKRRAKSAGIAAPTLHSFRRAFAINMLRAGVDLMTIAKLLGHTSLAILQRYLKQTKDDVEAAHRRASPVDKWI